MVKLFTDTSANLPLKLIQKYGITVVPFSYTINNKEPGYNENTEFDGKAFYNAMRDGAKVNTSMIGVGKFVECFEKSLNDGDDIMYIGMSGGISGAAHSAALAVSELRDKYPARRICAIDTYAASLGEGMLVLKAAGMAEQGSGFDDIEQHILQLRHNMSQFFTVGDLEYLKKGGRISRAVALIGGMLNIKPILRGDRRGQIVLCDKVRGEKRARAALVAKYSEMVLDKSADIGIAHADNEQGADELIRLLRQSGFTGESLTVCYEPVTGAHVGPDSIALFFYGTGK